MRILALIFSLVIFFSACSAQESAHYKVIPQTEFQQKISSESSVQLIDVRTPQEFENAHLKDATNINVNDSDFETQVKNLDKNKAVYIYCKSGSRSAKAGKILEKLGFTEIYDLYGGFSSWTGETVQ